MFKNIICGFSWFLNSGTCMSASTCLAGFSFLQQLLATLALWLATWMLLRMHSMPRWPHNSSHWSSKTAAKGSLKMKIMVAGGLYQSISGLPENSKGAGDQVASYHYLLVYLMTNQHFTKHLKNIRREMGPNIKWMKIGYLHAGQSIGSNICGTTTSLEMSKKSSQSYQ